MVVILLKGSSEYFYLYISGIMTTLFFIYFLHLQMCCVSRINLNEDIRTPSNCVMEFF
jgi:hypothetical protein